MGNHFLLPKLLPVLCLLMKSKYKFLFWSFTLLFQILSIITQYSVWSRLYNQSIIFLLGTDFSSKQENNDSKNNANKIRKIIYIYIFISINWFFLQLGINGYKNDAIKIRIFYICIYICIYSNFIVPKIKEMMYNLILEHA